MWGRRLLVGLWLAAAVIAWNVVFDRAVWQAGEAFAEANVARHARGEPLPTLEEAYRPEVRRAALAASAWAGALLVAGAAAAAKFGVRNPEFRR